MLYCDISQMSVNYKVPELYRVVLKLQTYRWGDEGHFNHLLWPTFEEVLQMEILTPFRGHINAINDF